MHTHHSHRSLRYFAKNLGIVVGIVLIWRGVWSLIDVINMWLFDTTTSIITGIICIIAGFLILYLPDKDLKEIEKL
jgi:hypothetical protein